MILALDHPSLQALAWTLLHFLWQGTLLGLAAKAGLRLLRTRGPQARYLLGCAVLLLMALAPLATFALLRPAVEPAAAAALVEASRSAALPAAAAGGSAWNLRALAQALRPALPWALALWLAGVALLGLRLLGGWLWLLRLRTRLAEPAGAAWQLTVNALARRLRVRTPVRILRSLAVDTPMVVGWIKPLILVPAAAFTGLSPAALEAVLAHELAHVRRHDYLVNLLQSVVEVLLFYHPAVWWLSAQVRQERELCCDDAAVALFGDPVHYAQALADLEALRALPPHPQHRLATAAHGGSLMRRIQRLLSPSLPPSPTRRAGALAALAVTALGAGTALRLQDAPPKPAAKTAPAERDHRTLVLVQDGDRLNLQMKGDVKLQPDGKPGFSLGEGASLEIRERAKDGVRSFKARRDKGQETRSFTVDGKEQAVDEAWLAKRLEQAKELEAKTRAAELKAKQAAAKARTAEGEAAKAEAEAKRIEVRIRTGKDGKEVVTEDIRCGPAEGEGKKHVIIRRVGPGGAEIEEHKGEGGADVRILRKPGKDGKSSLYVFKDGDRKRVEIDVERIAREARERAHDLQFRLRDLHGLEGELKHLDPLDFDFDFEFDGPEAPKVFRWHGPDGERRIEIEKRRIDTEKRGLEAERRSAEREMEALKLEMERLRQRMERLQKRIHEEGQPAPPAPPKAPKAPKAPAGTAAPSWTPKAPAAPAGVAAPPAPTPPPSAPKAPPAPPKPPAAPPAPPAPPAAEI